MNILFIGIGNMGGAIARSLLVWKTKDRVKDMNIYAVDKVEDNFKKLKEYGELLEFKPSMIKDMDVIFIAVKPHQVAGAVAELVPKIDDKKIITCMAAGITIEKLEGILGADKKIIRIMPNLPLIVEEGLTSITPNKNATREDQNIVERLLRRSSKIAEIPEEKIDAFIGMAGSSPAFMYIFIEAMADAGVKYGLNRDEAYYFAAQTMIGAGKMVLENKTNPGVLKDAVCSPGGTTIEGICALEEGGFRSAIIKAISRTIEKSKVMDR